jgi:hypothetical protein
MYYAAFRMNYATVTLPPHAFKGHSKSMRFCLIAAEIAITRFIVDVKVLVREGLEADTRAGLASHDAVEKEAAQKRLDNLHLWLASLEPLSFEQDAYIPLLRAINQPGSPVILPLGRPDAMSTLELAALLYSMAKPTAPKRVEAPIYSKGSFLPVLKTALKFIADRLVGTASVGAEQDTTRILATVLDKHHIHHVPWSSPPVPNTPGRNSSKPVFNYWRSTGKGVEQGQAAAIQVLDIEEQEELAVRDVATTAKRLDTKASWSIDELTIGSLQDYLDKQVFPDDCSIDNASLLTGDNYVTTTYNWVGQRLDARNEIHHLGLIIGHMLSKVTPFLAHGPLPSHLGSARGDTQRVNAAVRNEAWITNTSSRKGCNDSLPFIIMLPVFLIAITDPRSPLRQQMARQHESLGEAWTKKHGMFHSHVLFIQHHRMLILRPLL